MKLRHKKIFISGTALTVAGVLGVGTLLQTSVSVQASSEMMPGIEEIIKNASSDNESFKILEIVDDKSEAEIGYYISGQEPYIKLYQYEYQDADKNTSTLTFSSLEDGLSKITDSKTRKEFAENKKYNDDGTEKTVDEDGNPVTTGIKDISYAVGDDAPLSFSPYQESYFENPGDWTRIDFQNPDGTSRTEEVEIQGQYQQNPSGTGDYTKQEQTYYPIRENTGDKTNESDKFRENIQNFFYSEGDGASAPYYVEFEKVSNSWLNELLKTDEGRDLLSQEYDYSSGRYGYYENVYSNLTTDLADAPSSYPGENPEKPENLEPILTVAPLQEETQFTQGENEFSSDGSATQDSVDAADSADAFNDADSFGSGVSNDAAVDTSGSVESDSADAEAAFSGGEFSDSQQMGDNVDDGNGDSSAADGQGAADQGQTDNNAAANDTDANTGTENGTDGGTDTGNESSADADNGTESGNDTNADSTGDKPQTLKPTSQDTSVGTSANPYVYLGTQIDVYPYYSYTAITDLQAAKKEAEDNAKKQQEADEKDEIFIPGDQAITVEDGQYYYWQVVGNDMKKSPITIITGKQPVSYSDLLTYEVDPELSYDYYYRVSAVYFCCKMQSDNTDETDPKNYDYYGWYYASHPQGEEIYLPETGSNATYYVSDAEYKLTPGTGDYDFIPGDGEGTKTYKVEIDHMYYTGGYTNHDWFKRYVFHLDPDAEETKADFKNFNIEVHTMTASEFEKEYGNKTEDDTSDTDTEVAQFTDSEFTDNEPVDGEFTDDTSTPDIGDDSADVENTDGQVSEVVSEVEPMVSEAGVELVSIEKEISENSSETEPTSESSETEPAEDNNSEQTEDDSSNEEGSNNSNEENSSEEFQDDTTAAETDAVTSAETQETTSEFSAPEAEFTDSTADQETVFSAGETQTSDSTAIAFSDYDLIYINGILTENAARVITQSSTPCILNSVKVVNDTEFTQKYAGFIKEEDADGHYVNDIVYFFRNNLGGNGSEKDLLNTSFHQNFNSSDSEITDGNDAIKGFEEILEYIESENQYRKIGSTDVSDGTEVSLLTDEISQARAIEYIINYKHKRKTKTKDNINALEITPDSNGSQLTYSDIYKWMGEGGGSSDKINVEIKDAKACHEETENVEEGKKVHQIAENVLYNNNDIWHSIWQYNPAGKENKGWDGTKEISENGYQGHHITLILAKSSDVSGITYTSQSGKNGVLVSGLVEFKDANGKTISVEDKDGNHQNVLKVETGLSESKFSNQTVDISFGQTVQDVKEITIYFTETLAVYMAGNANKFATCARLSVFYTPEVEFAKIADITANSSHIEYESDGTTINTKTSEIAGNMIDGNSSTIWHSAYDTDNVDVWKGNSLLSDTGHTGHYITVTLENSMEVNGFMYQPRQTGTNGVLIKCAADFYDENNNLIDSVSNIPTGLSSSDNKKTVDVMFGKTIANVKTVKIYFTNTLSSKGGNGAFASCAQLKIFNMPEKSENITITSMTASEFVGHIDDINAEYDMIYISDNGQGKNSYVTGSGELLYTHVGDGKLITFDDKGNLPTHLFKLHGTAGYRI